MDPLTAYATIAVAAVTLLAVLVAWRSLHTQAKLAKDEATRSREEAERARRAMGMDSLWRLWAWWDGIDMRRTRAVAAKEILARQQITVTILDVLNFFERLGFIVFVANAVDEREAWQTFSGWAEAYWRGVKMLPGADDLLAKGQGGQPGASYCRFRRPRCGGAY